MEQNSSSANARSDFVRALRELLRSTRAELESQTLPIERLKDQLEAVAAMLSEAGAEPEVQDGLRQLLHDVRSPLSAGLTWVELLEDDAVDECLRREGRRNIEQAVQEMTDLLGAQVEQSNR
jgi:hypothetical protein